MILVGQYDSPFVRRVAISLLTLGIPFTRDTRSVYGDFDAMRGINPLARIPSLVLASGEVLVDSAAILDHIDETVGPERALIPPAGAARRHVLQRIALAAGTVEKIGGGYNFERMMRPQALRWADWMERCLTQGLGALTALDALDWPERGRIDQAEITTGCMLGYLHMTAPELLPAGRYPALEALWARLSARAEFVETDVAAWAVPYAE
jgi:glutathione S-transferase